MRIPEAARAWARRIKRDAMTLWYAASHPATPWHAIVLLWLAAGAACAWWVVRPAGFTAG